MSDQTITSPYPGALPFMAAQLVNSSLASTREFWRLKLGATEAEAAYPRDFAVVLSERAQSSEATPARAEAQDEGAAGERERIAREIDPVAFLDVQSRASGRNGERNAHAARMKALKKADEIIASRAHPSPTPAADADRVRIAVEALEKIENGTYRRGDHRKIAEKALAALKSTAAKEGGEG